MIRGVLDLADRPVRSIMSPRNEIEWLDLDEDEEAELDAAIRKLTSRVVVARRQVDEFIGVVRDLLLDIGDKKPANWDKTNEAAR